jgi:hypothetical protein
MNLRFKNSIDAADFKKSLLTNLASLTLSFVITIYSIYYQPIFAIRIFIFHTLGLILSTYLYYKIYTIPRDRFTVVSINIITYFVSYIIVDLLITEIIFDSSHRGKTEFAEAATFVETLVLAQVITFFAILVRKLSRLLKKKSIVQY